MLLPSVPPAVIRPALPKPRPQLAATAQASPRVTGVPLNALRGAGESRFLGPGGAPRLVPLAPFNPKGKPIVFIHGILGDPADEEMLIHDAQARGMQVWAMAYDTVGKGAQANAAGFATEMRKLGDRGVRDVTVVAHSLGGMTFK
ncbi:MAG TPA: alpha/beta hydrolase, partial [Oscillatoriaceae cyanobacterium]